MIDVCGVLPARHTGGLEPVEGCPLPYNHEGPHRAVCRRNGLVEWGREDDECDCCDPADPDRCFWFARLEGGER